VASVGNTHVPRGGPSVDEQVPVREEHAHGHHTCELHGFHLPLGCCRQGVIHQHLLSAGALSFASPRTGEPGGRTPRSNHDLCLVPRLGREGTWRWFGEGVEPEQSCCLLRQVAVRAAEVSGTRCIGLGVEEDVLVCCGR